MIMYRQSKNFYNWERKTCKYYMHFTYSFIRFTLQSLSIYKDLTLKKIVIYMGVDHDKISKVMAHVFQNMISLQQIIYIMSSIFFILLQSLSIYKDLTLKKIVIYMGVDHDEISTAMAHVLQNMISAVTNLDKIRKERDDHEEKRRNEPNLRLRPYFYVYDKIGVFFFNHYCVSYYAMSIFFQSFIF